MAGDFNDYHDNEAPQLLYRHGMRNITREARGSNGAKGTYKFQGEWRSIDHVMATEAMARRVATARIADERFLMEEDGRHGGLTPARNYRGRRYSEGFSDHLPLVVRFNLEVSD